MKGILSQKSFTSGEINPLAIGRRDLSQYASGLKKARNVIILPQGGVVKRPGFCHVDFVCGKEQSKNLALIPFHDSRRDSVLIVLLKNFSHTSLSIRVYEKSILVYEDQVAIDEFLFPAQRKKLVCPNIRYTQYGDTVILTEGNVPPLQLVRKIDSLDRQTWELTPLLILNKPYYLFDVKSNQTEVAWSDEKGFPQYCAFYENRLFLAATKTLPQTIWGSKSSIYFDFGTSSPLRDDDALECTLVSSSSYQIQSLYSSRSLFVFTDAGEWYNPNKPLTPSNFGSFVRQTEHGTSDLSPIFFEDGIVFHQKNSNIVRISKWDFALDSFISEPLTYLGGHLINDPVCLAGLRGAPPYSANYLFVVNSDGTMAVANLETSQQILNWVSWDSVMKIRWATVSNKVLYVIFEEPQTGHYISAYADANYFFDFGYLTNNYAFPLQDPDRESTLYFYNNQHVSFSGAKVAVLTDRSYYPEVIVDEVNQLTVPENSRKFQFGFPISMEIETLPLSFNNSLGPAWSQKKRISKVTLELKESASFRIIYNGIPIKATAIFGATGGRPTAIDGKHTIPLLGYDPDGTIKITQDSPLPFMLLSIDTEVVV